MMMMMVVVVAIMMMIKMMIINNFLNGDERHEDGWKLCRLLLKICPKRLNFVGFFEEKILTPPPPPPPIRKPAILRGVRMRNGTFHRAIASSAKRLVLKYEPRSKRASKVDLLRADSFLGNLVPRVLSYPPPGARERERPVSLSLAPGGG